MGMSTKYTQDQPTRADIDAHKGPLLLEFGTDWCGWCQGAQPLIAAAFPAQGDLPHLKVEDGKGRPLGRSFGIKLWPSLIFMKDGVEVARLVRPQSAEAIREGFDKIT
jgi:thioredoxin